MTAAARGRERPLVELRDRLHAPTLGTAVVDVDGPVDIEVVGTRRRGGVEPVTAGDQWHLGSCGKAVTAALYARLVEMGLAAWGTPVAALFPDLAGEIAPGWSGSTIDDLLRCRAGTRPDLRATELRRAWADPAPVRAQRTQVVRDHLSRPPSGAGRFRYSNLAYVIAGAAMERITDLPFEEALLTHLLGPLGVTTAGFGPPPDVWGHRALLQIGGFGIGSGDPRPPGAATSDNPAVLSPAGRLHVSLADWARFHRLFLRDGADLLTPASVLHLTALPPGRRTMAMGWAPARIGTASLGMQGSNTYWVATALVDQRRRRAGLVVADDGRTANLSRTAHIAASLLAG